MILEEETYERFGYYPSDLSPKSGRKILAACDDCGIVRVILKSDYHPFCRSCSRKGERNHNWKGGIVRRICEWCGKEFEVRSAYVRVGKGRFCSISCSKKGKNHPKWTGDKVKRICEVCGKEFLTKLCLIRIGYGRFCSRACARKKQVMPTHHTELELMFEAICLDNNIPSEYVGDGAFWIGKKGKEQHNPDFIIKINGKRYIIEIDGDYWHSPLLNHGLGERRTVTYREKFYKKHRWIPIFIWGTDLKREDSEAFVLSQLEKYGIRLKRNEK